MLEDYGAILVGAGMHLPDVVIFAPLFVDILPGEHEAENHAKIVLEQMDFTRERIMLPIRERLQELE